MSFIIPCGFPFWLQKSSPFISRDSQTTDTDYSEKATISRTAPKLSPTNKKNDPQPQTSPTKKAAKTDPSQSGGGPTCSCQPHPVTANDPSQEAEDELPKKHGCWLNPKTWVRKLTKQERKARQLREQTIREKRFRTNIYGNDLARYHGLSYSNIDLPVDYATASEIPGRVNAGDSCHHFNYNHVGSREALVTARPVNRLRNSGVGNFGHGAPAGVDPMAWAALPASIAHSYGYCM